MLQHLKLSNIITVYKSNKYIQLQMIKPNSTDRETVQRTQRPFSQTFTRSENLNKKIFIPFKQERDSMGRLLQSSLAVSRISQNPEQSQRMMNQYLMNTIELDKNLKYQGFIKKGPDTIKTRTKSAIGKKSLIYHKNRQVIPFYNPNKNFLMKRPQSAIIFNNSKSSRTIPKQNQQFGWVQKPKKKVYSFKFSYPKSLSNYIQTPVSDEDIRKMKEMTTAENRRRRIKKEMPALMFVQNVKLCATPEEMHERWATLTLQKQQIISKLTKISNN